MTQDSPAFFEHRHRRPATPPMKSVLEAVVNGRARFLMTFNRRDFGVAPARFGVLLCTPAEYLRSLQA